LAILDRVRSYQKTWKRGFGMKQMLVAVLSVALLSGVCRAGDKLDMTDEKVRLSYSVGYQVGGDFLRQGMDINPELLLKGVQDALLGKEPLMTPQEMRTTLVDLQKKVAAVQAQTRKVEAEKNLAEGKVFLAENAKKAGVKTLPSDLQYKVIKEGSGAMPKATDTVTVHYRGILIDGTEFDSSYRRGKPASFRVDRVISGWKEALLLMKEGARWQLFIPPELGYGDKSAGRIEPNSTLIFEVELISVN
jgi:FKBP-type peptidyl-prolyl cis-trans isomerase FklB